MTAQQFLQQYMDAELKARRKREQYLQTLEQIDCIGSTLGAGAGMPHGSGISRRAETVAIRLADSARRWLDAVAEADIAKRAVMDMIDRIGGYGGQVLYERYINICEWSDVAEKMNFSPSRVYQLHRLALKDVAGILECEGEHGGGHQTVSGSVPEG